MGYLKLALGNCIKIYCCFELVFTNLECMPLTLKVTDMRNERFRGPGLRSNL